MNKVQQTRFDSLYQRHVNALTRQGKSTSTIEAYSRAVRRIAAFFDRCPDRLSREDLEAYFSSLIKTHSWSTIKLDRNGLQFFYTHVLKQQWQWVDIIKPPVVKSLPDILTQAELAHLLHSTREPRYHTYFFIVYSMGLRLSEALNLKVGDIDAQRMRVHIRCGKGRQDRFVILPEAALLALRRYWATHRNPSLLFPTGLTPDEQHSAKAHMDRGGLQKSFTTIARQCGIHKHVSIHSLRHCYGTHLIEAGLNLRAIQQEMGHQSPTTTALYTRLTDCMQQQSSLFINRMVDQLQALLGSERGQRREQPRAASKV